MSSQDARARFLAQASLLLFPACPSISASLAYDQFCLAEADGQKKDQSLAQHSCQACGSLEVSLRTRSFAVKPSNRSKARNPLKAESRRRQLILLCSRCARITQLNLPPTQLPKFVPIEADRTNPANPPVSEHSPLYTDRNSGTKSTSKQRAKARKENQGLQGLIQRSKQKSENKSFDLMDFMQTKP